MQTVYLWFPIAKRIPMCTTSSNRWELAIVIGVGEGSVGGITARLLITHSCPMYVYSDGVLEVNRWNLLELCTYIYTIYCTISVYIYLQKWLLHGSCTEGHVKCSRHWLSGAANEQCESWSKKTRNNDLTQISILLLRWRFFIDKFINLPQHIIYIQGGT